MDKKPLTLSQINLYNPQEHKDEVIQQLFVARQKQFRLLLEKIAKETSTSIPQHHLIIAQRGMGKTSLLKRIEVELRTGDMSQTFIPILMPEELYDLRSIARFFIKSLDRLADTLEKENNQDEANNIDSLIAALQKLKSNEEIAKKAFNELVSLGEKLKRRVVILVDNIGFVFEDLDQSEQHLLRALLIQNKSPILIAANARTMEATTNYGAPFYDAFQMHYLKKLSFEELQVILLNLADLTDSTNVRNNLVHQKGRLKSLHQLTGGNPRTMTMLFRMIVKGFSEDIQDDLNSILDEVTPLYKDRFEKLSEQMRRIVMAIAMHWDPINTTQLKDDTSLENKQLSPQLSRLLDSGWIMTEDIGKKKNKSYIISERLFNMWLLMRQGTRKSKKELYGLSRFLDLYYGEQLSKIATARLGMVYQNQEQAELNLAIASSLKDKKLKKRLLFESNIAIFKFKRENLITEITENLESGNFEVALSIINEQIQSNPGNSYYYTAKAIVLSEYLNRHVEAKDSLLESIKTNNNSSIPWYHLANLYEDHFQDFLEAKKAYLNSTKLKPKIADPWNGLGNLYQDYLKQYDKAERAYKKVIEIDASENASTHNLIFLLRDKLGRPNEAKEVFSTLESISSDTYHLQESLFALYDSNLGIAKEKLLLAISIIKDKLPIDTQDDWWRYGSVVYKLGHLDWHLNVLKEQQMDSVLSPYYVALGALQHKDPELHFKSVAVEKRPAAREIYDKMRMFLSDEPVKSNKQRSQ